MAPQRNNEHRHSGNPTGTIPKTKVRNNCNVPQEAVTPTRRDMTMTSNLVSTSLDWVPVSEYNSRSNYNQSRKPANNSDHELTDLENSATFDSGFGRFVPVRPQPRVLPLNVQRDSLTADHNDDGAGSTASGYSQHGYPHAMQNGLNPHSNHAAAAVMIVNPTTPNAVTGNISQPYNAPGNQTRNNLSRNLNAPRNNLDAPARAKTVNLESNMYEQGSNGSDNGRRAAAACPDAAAVERRLGQIREYIRVTSSLVDTMRGSEDEAYIEHTKEEYDELVGMVMKLKESETKLVNLLEDKEPDNIEVPADEAEADTAPASIPIVVTPAESPEPVVNEDIAKTPAVKDSTATPAVKDNNTATSSVKDNTTATAPVKDNTANPTVKATNTDLAQALKKVTNIENEQLNKTLQSNVVSVEEVVTPDSKPPEVTEIIKVNIPESVDRVEEKVVENIIEIKEIDTSPLIDIEVEKEEHVIDDTLRQNILSCVEKVARIEEMKNKNVSTSESDNQVTDVVVRPMSSQSNGSAYSENELWQNEIKNKMEISQQRLAALKQQQKRLLKYQEEAKQQLEEMHRARQEQEMQPSRSHDNLAAVQNQLNGHHQQAPKQRVSVANQAGTSSLPTRRASANVDHSESGQREEASGGEAEDEDGLSDRGRQLTMKLRELQMKKQHMESLVSEFQKLQMATRLESSHNTYSSSGEESLEEEPARKYLMRSVENYEEERSPSAHDEPFPMSAHANNHDNKSDGSAGGWSNEGSVRRVRNSLPPRHKYTNEQHEQHQSHEANIASLQEMAQELRMETEKIMGERARLKDIVSNKAEFRRKQQSNSEAAHSSHNAHTSQNIHTSQNVHSPHNVQTSQNDQGSQNPYAHLGYVPGPAERRQMQLRAILAEKQKELESLLNKEKVLCGPETQMKPNSRAASIVNQSYNSEQEEPDSRSEQIMIHNEAQNARENENYRGGGDSSLSGRPINALPSHLGSVYASDSDSASRTKSNQRNRGRRRPPQDRQPEETPQSPLSHPHVNINPGVRHEPRVDTVNVNTVPPMMPHGVDALPPMPYLPPPCWGKPDERLYPSPLNYAMPPPPGALPMSSCACACALWAAWSWQQCALQQRETLALRQQIASLEERWRSSVETASHTLNNQVPPGNRANNYWDNFRSYSRQNLLSASSKTNADGHLGVVPQHNPHPLVERSHNTLHAAPAPTPPSNTPKRNINASTTQNTAQTNQPINNAEEFTNRHGRSNVTYERSLSFSSAPDVLNLNQNNEQEASSSQARNLDDVNINRQEPANAFRNLNITNPIPEIIQSHANNINTTSNSLNSKKKSCSKLPAKNSANRRNNALDYSQTSNINIASTSEAPNPNLASANREVNDKATTKLFEFLRENVYSEVTALIGVNESHPDFLIQLFRELQLISSDPLRHRVLQSIRSVLSQYPPIIENENNEHIVNEEQIGDTVTTTTHETNSYQENAMQEPNSSNTNPQNDNGIVHFLFLKSEDVCSPELLDMLASVIINSSNSRQQISKKRILETLAKYEGSRVCDVSGEILESLSLMLSVNNDGDESTQHTGESESSILQDVAGSLNLFSSSDTQLHQMNGFPYDMWAGHMELDQGEDNARNDGKLDLINCSEMLNGELAEADQTCPEPPPPELPDVVEDETTPTEAEAEWLGLDRVPTRLHTEDSSENQKD